MTQSEGAHKWRVAVAAGCELGERPVWDDHLGSVIWVDVLKGELHRSTPAPFTGPEWTDRSVPVGGVLGAVGLRHGGGLIAAADDTFLLLDERGALESDPVSVYMHAGARFNDAACDPGGRFLAGTTSSHNDVADGVLWSLAPSLEVKVVLGNLSESNGLDWSQDAQTMYFVDSGEPVIRRYRYDTDSGVVGPRCEDLAVFDAGQGVPDGLVVDADGAIWVALWGGGALRRYAPDGELLLHLEVPVSHPTCPSFAGPGLRSLVVTSGWEGMDPCERLAEPWAGHLLVNDIPSRGRLPTHFAGHP